MVGWEAGNAEMQIRHCTVYGEVLGDGEGGGREAGRQAGRQGGGEDEREKEKEERRKEERKEEEGREGGGIVKAEDGDLRMFFVLVMECNVREESVMGKVGGRGWEE